MKEEECNWSSTCEEELPTPDELMPLSQSLITPHLASAFDIRARAGEITPVPLFPHHHHHPNHGVQPPPTQPNSSEFDSSSAELGGVGGDESARTLKRPRLVWTPQLHKRFVDAVAHLGIKNAVPKTIMQLMNVDGLTRENVASHLQKYRLYLKRMQSLNNGAAGNGPGSVLSGSGDPAIDHLFASSPVPAHFLHGGSGGNVNGGARPNSDHFVPYMGVAAVHHQPMAAPLYQQMEQYRGGGQFDHSYMSRQAQMGPNRNGILQSLAYVEEVETDTGTARKVLTLFPTGDE